MRQLIFKSIRSVLVDPWSSNVKKMLPLLAMAFLASFNYYALKSAKDAVIIASSCSGVETIPFIKLIALLPSAILMTLVFSFISIKFKAEQTVHMCIGFFLTFFLLFATVIYPMRDSLHLHSIGNLLDSTLPPGMRGFNAMIRFWPLSMFYIMCELWGPMVLNLCVWGFINEITAISDVASVYPLLKIAVNAAGIFSGALTISFAKLSHDVRSPFEIDAWDQTLTKTLLSVVVVGIVIMVLFRIVNRTISNNNDRKWLTAKNSEETPSLRESIRLIMKSSRVRFLSIMVFSFGVAVNAVEILWKAAAKQAFQDKLSLAICMNKVSMLTSALAVLSSILFSKRIVKNMVWMKADMITPSLMMIMTIIFFICLFSKDYIGKMLSSWDISPAVVVLTIGILQTSISRASKCSLFDIFKDMSLITPKNVSRIREKAFVDGIASRAGKSFVSIMFAILLTVTGSLDTSAPLVAIVTIISITAWLFAAKNMCSVEKEADTRTKR